MQNKIKFYKEEQDPENKILFALERLSQALRSLLWDIAKEEGLSPIQIQFLLYMHTHKERRRRVSNLAQEFGLTQATVSDAIRVLVRRKLVDKKPASSDGRVFTLNLTAKGKRLSLKLSDWQVTFIRCIKKFPLQTKTEVIGFLMELIAELQNSGIINVARMCITCSSFQKDIHPGSKKPHRCGFSNMPMGSSEFRFDCNWYKLKSAHTG